MTPDEREPSVLIVRLLEACNAGCFMCGYAFSKDDYRFGRAELGELLIRLRGSAIRVLRMTGGEPMLINDLPGMLADISGAGILSSVISNGWHLPEKWEAASNAGLDQIVLSLDAPAARDHDKFRRLDGLFDRLVAGVCALKSNKKKMVVRVNTVVGAHNAEMLPDIWRLLCALNVDQWSLIPLKRAYGSWGKLELSRIEVCARALSDAVQTTTEASRKHPLILGYSRSLFGRDAAERRRLWHKGANIVPTGTCNLVDRVRYYTPKDGNVFPCNCLPHRSQSVQYFERMNDQSFTSRGLRATRDWLREHGPTHCKGCEPINAALGDNAIDIDDDPFGF